jgi:hypothetical protein
LVLGEPAAQTPQIGHSSLFRAMKNNSDNVHLFQFAAEIPNRPWHNLVFYSLLILLTPEPVSEILLMHPNS